MLPVEENTRRKEVVITFRQQGEHVSLLEPRGFFERSSSFCKRFVIKLGPNWTMFLPWHICAMTWHHATFGDFLVSLGFMGTYKPRFEMFEDEPWHRYGCNSFPFLAWDLNMHPRTHVHFSCHFGALENVFVVRIWIMDIKCLENSINEKNGQTNPE